MVYQQEISIETRGHRHMQRLDGEVQAVIRASGIRQGVVHVFNVGSTGAVGAIEFEPGLQGDLPDLLDRLVPPSSRYGHEMAWHDGNGHSHLQATLLGQAYSAPVRDGQLATGTWQQIVHLECDIRPRRRELVITVMGE